VVEKLTRDENLGRRTETGESNRKRTRPEKKKKNNKTERTLGGRGVAAHEIICGKISKTMEGPAQLQPITQKEKEEKGGVGCRHVDTRRKISGEEVKIRGKEKRRGDKGKGHEGKQLPRRKNFARRGLLLKNWGRQKQRREEEGKNCTNTQEGLHAINRRDI